jgi:3'-phosphoadenosine 5'-phosphosulfate sulfotransferase (PAPS reductase)/FAD synthetase
VTPDPAPRRALHPDDPQSWTDALQLPTLGRSLDAAIAQAHDILDRADREHPGAVARFALFSGGNDSSVMLDLVRHRCDAVIHINTGIGIAQTRDFVRTQVAQLGLQLIELHPPGITYREWVLEHGFPGPGAHLYMYRHLKERALRQFVRETLGRGRGKRVILYSGVRTAESARRRRNFTGRDIDRTGRVVWVAPIIGFSTGELAACRSRFAVAQNEVAVHLHMSGECLCGAFARPGELDEIDFWYPGVADEIRALEALVTAAGHQQNRWGAGRSPRRPRAGRLCSSCTLFDPETYADR